jgi:hypothetical protein
MKNSTTQSSSRQGKHCHHERHLSGTALKIYNLIWRLGKKSKDGIVWRTNNQIARMIGARVATGRYGGIHHLPKVQRHIERTKTLLVRAGLLEYFGRRREAKTGTWGAAGYRSVAHEDWATNMSEQLGQSTCYPEPLQIKVSNINPGGRRYVRKTQRRMSPDNDAAIGTSGASTIGTSGVAEMYNPQVPGSTSTTGTGKYAQSVDFKPPVDAPAGSDGVQGRSPAKKRGANSTPSGVGKDSGLRDDCGLRQPSNPFYAEGEAPSNPPPENLPGRKGKLTGRLNALIDQNKDWFDDNELNPEESAGIIYSGYFDVVNGRKYLRKCTSGFILAIGEVYETYKKNLPTPGNFCSKVITLCDSKIKGLRRQGLDRSEFYYPNDFLDHRDRLRKQERVEEKKQAQPPAAAGEVNAAGAAKAPEARTVKQQEEPTQGKGPSVRELRIRECYRFLEEHGISPELCATAAVRALKELFVMEPGLSPRRRFSVLLEQARTYHFDIPPELLAVKRKLDRRHSGKGGSAA